MQHGLLDMKELLICCFIVTSLMEVAMTSNDESFSSIFEHCTAENDDEWSKKVTVNEKKVTEESTEEDDAERSLKRMAAPTSSARGYFDWFSNPYQAITTKNPITTEKPITTKKPITKKPNTKKLNTELLSTKKLKTKKTKIKKPMTKNPNSEEASPEEETNDEADSEEADSEEENNEEANTEEETHNEKPNTKNHETKKTNTKKPITKKLNSEKPTSEEQSTEEEPNTKNHETKKTKTKKPKTEKTKKKKELATKTPSTTGVFGWIKSIAGNIGSFQSANGSLSAIGNVIKSHVAKKIKNLCSSIPEPIAMPDVNLTRALTFQAFDGRISGIRKLCERNARFPARYTKRDSRSGLKYKLELHGLRFHYHILDKRLGVNRTFNWALKSGSFAEMSFLVGLSLPCALSVEDIDVKLNFDGMNGKRKCIGDCSTILGKMQCYLYYSMVYAIKYLVKPLKRVANKFACLSFKVA